MIAILLSTFNGACFLHEQLDSLLQQTYKEFVLYIRDDGSNDDTMKIVKRYVSLYSNFVFLNDEVKHRGACQGFLWMLKQVHADYYMFCDQDDVWMPFKIELTYKIMQAEETRFKDMPILIHTDLTVTDSSLNIIHPSLWMFQKTSPMQIGEKYLCLVNYVTGCTALFNSKLCKLAISGGSDAIMHDHWIGICADAAGGRILSIPTATIYYRQHCNNTIGAKKDKSKPLKIFRYIHLPDFKYNCLLYKMLKAKYHISLLVFMLKKIAYLIKC